jgi:hypothetical protein
MANPLAIRTLTPSEGSAAVRLELDQPLQTAENDWSCAFRIVEGNQVFVDDEAIGSDALQAIVSAIAGLRWYFDEGRQQGALNINASWFHDEISTGLPIYLPQGLGQDFDRHLRELVEKEVRERARELEVKNARSRVGQKTK